MKNRKTYEWINGVAEEVGVPKRERHEPRPRNSSRREVARENLGIQELLLLFTFSSVLMIFAGLGLIAACTIFYSLIIG